MSGRLKATSETIGSSLEGPPLDGATRNGRHFAVLPLFVPILAVVFYSLSFIAALPKFRSPRCYCAMWTAIRWPWVCSNISTRKTILWGDCRRRRPFRYSYLTGVPVGATLAGQRPDGRGCERLSLSRGTCPATGNAIPSTYVIPHLPWSYPRRSSGAFMRYRRRLIY